MVERGGFASDVSWLTKVMMNHVLFNGVYMCLTRKKISKYIKRKPQNVSTECNTKEKLPNCLRGGLKPFELKYTCILENSKKETLRSIYGGQHYRIVKQEMCQKISLSKIRKSYPLQKLSYEFSCSLFCSKVIPLKNECKRMTWNQFFFKDVS